MEEYLEQWMDSMDMSGLNVTTQNFFPGLKIDGEVLLSMVMNGQIGEAAGTLYEQIKGSVWGEVSSLRELLLCILVLGIVSALFAEFSDLFSGKQTAQAGFFFLYLFLIAVLMKVFVHVSQIAGDTISAILLFVKMFVPTYFMTVGAAGGISTAAYYYYLTLLAAYFIESILSSLVIPLVYSYVLFALLNGLWPEEKLTLLLDTMKKGINLILKLLIGAMTGLSLVQSLILPVADGLKKTAIHKTFSFLPGVGGLAGSVAELFLGSAVLIKNSVGILCVLFLLGICLLPLCKLAIVSGIIKLGAAITGIVSDKRISGAANRVGEGCFMLFQCVCTSIAMFVIVIAVVAYAVKG